MNVMRYGYIILLAAVLSLAASPAVVVPALSENATAMPSPGQASQANEPYKVWPLPIAGMPAASSPAVQLPTATPTVVPTATPIPIMKPTALATTGEGGR
ncbi:MAG TPA: hypothetical protein VGJ92_02325 [Methanocella sp.]